MSEKSRIQHQLRYAIEGSAWHGPSVNEILSDVEVSQAQKRHPDAAHSISELALHITAWLDTVRVRLGGTAMELSEAEDWPRVRDTSEAAWAETLSQLERAYRELHHAIGEITDVDLNRVAAGRTYNNYFMLHGVIQHTLYHAGQMMMLKRMTGPE